MKNGDFLPHTLLIMCVEAFYSWKEVYFLIDSTDTASRLAAF